MATKEIKMPHLGESVTEAAIVQWLVKPGDSVKRYDPLMEVVSDKVTTEVPSDFDGVVKRISDFSRYRCAHRNSGDDVRDRRNNRKTEVATLAPVKEASAEQAQEHETVATTSTATSHQKIMVVIPQQSLKLPKKKRLI